MPRFRKCLFLHSVPYLCQCQGVVVVVAFSRIDCFQNNRKYWPVIHLKKAWVVEENLVGQSIAKHKWQSCAIHVGVVVTKHRLLSKEWEKLSLPRHCEIFTKEAVRKDWVIGIKSPEDIFEGTGAIVGVLIDAFLNGLTSFQVLAPISCILSPASFPPTHRLWISCHYSDGGSQPLLRIPILIIDRKPDSCLFNQTRVWRVLRILAITSSAQAARYAALQCNARSFMGLIKCRNLSLMPITLNRGFRRPLYIW